MHARADELEVVIDTRSFHLPDNHRKQGCRSQECLSQSVRLVGRIMSDVCQARRRANGARSLATLSMTLLGHPARSSSRITLLRVSSKGSRLRSMYSLKAVLMRL